ncbi:7-carboxy-7-deazaguanine synthase QueE, partial [Neisseria meningitidis]
MKKINVAPENPQYRIVEIFGSLQGEGWNSGMPAVFVRLG